MDEADGIWLTIVLLFVIAYSAVTIYGEVVVKDTVTITVKDKLVKVDSDSSRYLIFSENEVFQNTDSWLNGKFNSSDVYNSIDKGGTYNVTVCGWRVPILSWYRNILRVSP